ncbi:APC family permease [Peptoniphilus indolicus]|uniref:APC family amino acid transporter n=2 Tax=Peptoniphilus indolicus TaxID=33030 RepID=G4D182_9FIRM|nr:APC family permease [Peptoniphilus indolicus]EGY80716.1 APC family amino acid transporter [Peptoniphilus indolicus ATCC 29427]SUB74865.1 putative fructoselysine transporter [Peptoniphilus indolicus]
MNVARIEEKSLKLFDVFNLGFGGAVGSGIFVLMGLGIEYTGKSVVLAVGVGCLVMLLAYFYNVLLSSMFVFKGGDYSQKAICFGPVLTGVGAYITFINGFSIAMYSVAIVEYLSIVFPEILPYTKILAVIIITVLFGATIKGSKFISTLNSIMTVVLICSILSFIIFGLPKVTTGYFSGTDFFKDKMSGFISAIAIMGWACQGTTMGPVSVSAVTINSKRNIPLGILLVTVVLALVYALMSYVAAGVLPIDQVAGQNLSVVAREIFPSILFVIFIIGGATFAIATSMITGVTMVRYPMLKVAEDGWLPKVFTKTTDSGYPWAVYLLYYIISIIPVVGGFSLGAMVSLVMIPSMLMNAYCNAKCIKLIKQHDEQWDKSILHMPKLMINLICIASSICALIVCYNLFISFKPVEKIFMVAILLLVLVLSVFCLKTGRVKKSILEENRLRIIKEALEEE